MGLVQYFIFILMLTAHLAFTSPTLLLICPSGGRKCEMCPPGTFLKGCTHNGRQECEPCPAGQFMDFLNCEDDCTPCFADCRADYNLKVVQNCTRITNIKCVCEDGFKCLDVDQITGNCRLCDKIQETTIKEAAAAVTSGKDKKTPSSAFAQQSSTSAKPCPFPKCGLQTVSPTSMTETQLAAILCPVVAVGCVALVILFCVRRPGEKTCFKEAIVKLYNEGGRDTSRKSMESAQHFPRDSFSAKQQPSSFSAANLGPVHVHNPGTVIFSLLSQFTGQVGPTVEGGKTAERVSSEEDDERDCPVCHPTSSPSIHLSEEERSGEIDSIFFPSQEQGKDCHMSKEEEL
ncbi:uncharacterized protein LOC113136590 [Mastacembelus armatus]|uniref:uncharacterized protein LOC113136590 n=1 Tax=Mastacembelus armatus TaxID=205130 RepID=UPI000E459580|nr:uncharacterized protein LOC113136590 [Mastacembelus armatus]